MRPTPEDQSVCRVAADTVGVRNGWLLVTDDSAGERWSVRLADVEAWWYDVGGGRLTIHIRARSIVVTANHLDDPFEVPNELDDLLYWHLVGG